MKIKVPLKGEKVQPQVEEQGNNKKVATAKEQQAAMPTQHQTKNQMPQLSMNEAKNDLSENLFRTPQLLGMAERPSPSLANLGNPELSLDMRSPAFNFLNEQFIKPSLITQRLPPPFRDDFGASPPLNTTLLNESQDSFQAPRNRKSSFENYFQYLGDASSMWGKLDAANGLKLRSPQFPMMTPHGIGDFLNYNSGGFPQRDLPPFMLDDSYMDPMRLNPTHFEIGDLRGQEPSKKVKKE